VLLLLLLMMMMAIQTLTTKRALTQQQRLWPKHELMTKPVQIREQTELSVMTPMEKTVLMEWAPGTELRWSAVAHHCSESREKPRACSGEQQRTPECPFLPISTLTLQPGTGSVFGPLMMSDSQRSYPIGL